MFPCDTCVRWVIRYVCTYDATCVYAGVHERASDTRNTTHGTRQRRRRPRNSQRNSAQQNRHRRQASDYWLSHHHLCGGAPAHAVSTGAVRRVTKHTRARCSHTPGPGLSHARFAMRLCDCVRGFPMECCVCMCHVTGAVRCYLAYAASLQSVCVGICAVSTGKRRRRTCSTQQQQHGIMGVAKQLVSGGGAHVTSTLLSVFALDQSQASWQTDR